MALAVSSGLSELPAEISGEHNFRSPVRDAQDVPPVSAWFHQLDDGGIEAECRTDQVLRTTLQVMVVPCECRKTSPSELRLWSLILATSLVVGVAGCPQPSRQVAGERS